MQLYPYTKQTFEMLKKIIKEGLKKKFRNFVQCTESRLPTKQMRLDFGRKTSGSLGNMAIKGDPATQHMT